MAELIAPQHSLCDSAFIIRTRVHVHALDADVGDRPAIYPRNSRCTGNLLFNRIGLERTPDPIKWSPEPVISVPLADQGRVDPRCPLRRRAVAADAAGHGC